MPTGRKLTGFQYWPELVRVVSLPVIPLIESKMTALGLGLAQEFRPRWGLGNVYEPSGDDLTTDPSQISISQANDYSLRAEISALQGGPLHFTSLYYPAWRVTLEDGSVAPHLSEHQPRPADRRSACRRTYVVLALGWHGVPARGDVAQPDNVGSP